MADVNHEPRAIDEQMDRSIRGEPAKSNVIELLKSPRQRRVIRNREIQLEQLGDGTKEPPGLAERKVKDRADRQGCLDRDVRVGAPGFTYSKRSASNGSTRVARRPGT